MIAKTKYCIIFLIAKSSFTSHAESSLKSLSTISWISFTVSISDFTQHLQSDFRNSAARTLKLTLDGQTPTVSTINYMFFQKNTVCAPTPEVCVSHTVFYFLHITEQISPVHPVLQHLPLDGQVPLWSHFCMGTMVLPGFLCVPLSKIHSLY